MDKKKHGKLLYFGLGLLIIITTTKNSGFFLPWYLHFIIGSALSLYGIHLYINQSQEKTNKIIVGVMISVFTLVLATQLFNLINPNNAQNNSTENVQNNPLNDGNHPFWNASEYSFGLESEDITGLIKLEDNKILVQINQTNGLAYDSIHILTSERTLTNSDIFMTYVLDDKGLVLMGTTAKKSMIRFNYIFNKIDTLRVGFIYNDEPFKKIKDPIKLEVFKNSSIKRVTVDIK